TITDASWEPALDQATWNRVRAVLEDPTRKTSHSTAAAHLLSGLATCGVCGATMRGSQNRGVPSYRCSEKSCVSRRRDVLDEYVIAIVNARLRETDAAGLALRRPSDEVRHSAL